MIGSFDESKLGPDGFKILLSDNNVTLPNGEIVDNGLAFRNTFHLHPLCTADLFVPCGGRPESVNLSNIDQFLNEDGTSRFKIIVEGANLFFTNDARMVLEDLGVILFKDASTNKGGVTSSSLEVFAALALSEENFQEHMAVTEQNKPEFYQQYVQEIQNRLEADATLEFECIWREHKRTGIHRHVLTEIVSNKINEMNAMVAESSIWDNENVKDVILMEAIPKTLTALVPLENIKKTVPESYLKATFSCYVASRYIYNNGINASEFAFFEFMQQYIGIAVPIEQYDPKLSII